MLSFDLENLTYKARERCHLYRVSRLMKVLISRDMMQKLILHCEI